MKIIPNEYFLGMKRICWACGFPITNSLYKASKCCRNIDTIRSECQRAKAIYIDRVRNKNKEKKKKKKVKSQPIVMRVCLGPDCKPGTLFPSKGKFNRVCDKCSRRIGGKDPKKSYNTIDDDELES